MTDAARLTLAQETGCSPKDLERKVAVVHNVRNLAAAVSSGSFRTAGMVIVPCSINTLASIASCQTSNLLTRAADVCLKERRPVILVGRETLLRLGHFRAMVAAAESGAIIPPPVPGFYFGPKTIDDLIHHMIGKILDQLGWEHSPFKRWGETEPAKPDVNTAFEADSKTDHLQAARPPGEGYRSFESVGVARTRLQ